MDCDLQTTCVKNERRPYPADSFVASTNPLLMWTSYEESILAANSNGRKFLYHSKGLDAGSLLVKYYVPLALIKKVIKLLV